MLRPETYPGETAALDRLIGIVPVELLLLRRIGSVLRKEEELRDGIRFMLPVSVCRGVERLVPARIGIAITAASAAAIRSSVTVNRTRRTDMAVMIIIPTIMTMSMAGIIIIKAMVPPDVVKSMHPKVQI